MSSERAKSSREGTTPGCLGHLSSRACAVGALLCVVIFGACDASDDTRRFGRARDKDGQHLLFNINAEPESLDPALLVGHPDAFVARQLFEGLTETDPKTMFPTPALANRWEVDDDGRHYRFFLTTARWSDGAPITAADVIYSWERVLRPSTRARNAEHLFVIKHARDYHRGVVKRIGRAGIRPRRPPFVTFGGESTLGAPRLWSFAEGALVRIVDSNLRRVGGREAVVLRAAPEDGARSLGTLAPGETALLVARQLGEKGTVDAWAQVRPSLGGRAGWARESDLIPAFPPTDLRHVEGERQWNDRQPMRDAPDEGAAVILMVDDDEQVEVLRDLPGPWTRARHVQTGRAGFILDDALDDVAGDRHWFRVEVIASADTAELEDAEIESALTRTALEGWVPGRDLESDASILGLSVGEGGTLEVELEHPTPYFLSLTGTVPFRPVPPHVVDRHGIEWTHPENIVTSGAFHLAEHRPPDVIELVPSKTYRNEQSVKLSRVTLLPIADEHTSVNLYRAGFLDGMLSGNLPFELVPALRGRPDLKESPALSTYYLALNLARPPLDDPRVREALNLAIDKQELAERLLRGGETAATHLVPPGFVGYESPDGPSSDEERARALLVEAGYRDGLGFPPVEYLYNSGEKHRVVAEYVQRRWHEVLGIDVQLQSQEWKTYLSRLREGDFQIARSGWIADYLDPATFLAMFASGSGQNVGAYESAKYDALLRLAEQTADVDARLRLYREAEEILNRDLPVIPLFFRANQALVAPEVQGLVPNPLDTHALAGIYLLDAPGELLPEPTAPDGDSEGAR